MIKQIPLAMGLSTHVFTRTLTIDHTQVPSTQTNFPVLVNFTDATFKTVANGGHVKATNAFTFSSDSAGASLLKWEVERYNASTGEIVAWVKIASVDSTVDTVFYLRYGGTITTDQSDPTNVWTNSFTAVFHVKDGTTLSVLNSKTGNNGTNNGATATSGQIDGGAAFASASNQYFISGDTGLGTAAMTISAWINATSFPGAYNCVTGYNTATNYFILMVKSTGKLACYAKATTDRNYDGTGSNTLSSGTNYYLAMTYNSSAGLIGYVNGSSDGSASANGTLTVSDFSIATGRDDVNGRYWNGKIDEIRVASVARSADWLTCEYNNQKSSQTFVALGSES